MADEPIYLAQQTDLDAHTGNKSNPHSVTKAQVGLGNVDNTADANKSVKHATTAGSFATARTITLSGDVSGSVSFNGSKDVTITTTVADDSHNHTIANVDGLQTALDGKETSGAAATALTNAKSYTNSAVSTHNTSTSAHSDLRDLITALQTKLNNFLDVDDTTTDQLSELIALINENATDIESITSGKVNVTDIVNNLTTNVANKPLSAAQGVALKALIDALQTAVDGKAASSHTHSAYVNQNAFSNVVVGSTTISADSATDTLTLVAGSNITLTPDATNDKVTIAAKDTVYTHPSYTAKSSGFYKVTVDGTGHVSGTAAVTKADITGLGIPAQDTTYGAATTDTAGLMSADDKEKLDGIASGANKYSHPTYTAKSSGFYKVTVDGTGHVSGTSAVTKSDITALGIPAQDTVYTHPTSSGNKHIPSGGSSGQILRWSADGTAVWGADNNTTYSAATQSAAGLMSAEDKKKLDGITSGANSYTHPTYTAKSSGLYKVTVDGTGHVSAATAVTKADITGLGIPAQDTTYSAATTSAAGLMSAADKTKLNATNVAYGTCSTEAATAAKEVTVSGNTNWVLAAGSIITVLFSATNTASNPTLNVNGTGAKNIFYGASQITTSSLSYGGYANRPMTFMYDGTQYRFIGWGYDSNTAYTNVKLGHGYATCSTAAATAAKVGTLSSYTLVTGGIVAVKFTYAVPANATLNINSKGAKAIYHRGAKITAGVINAGDTATFMYSGGYYHLLSVDSEPTNITTLQSKVSTLETKVAALEALLAYIVGVDDTGVYVEEGV